jgi:hypothetical protein
MKREMTGIRRNRCPPLDRDHDKEPASNFVTAEARARDVAEARTGLTVSIARATHPAPLIPGPTAPTRASSTAVQTAMMFTGGPETLSLSGPAGIGSPTGNDACPA